MTEPNTRACPICGRPSSWNAPDNDPRCGPCHNFHIIEFVGPFSLIVEFDFELWITEQISNLEREKNLRTYRPWLSALRRAHQRHSEKILENS